MARVRLSVDIEPELRRRVRMVAASKDLPVREWIEDVLKRELEREFREREDRVWMEGDLSRLGEIEPYAWEEGELEEGAPVRYVPGVGAMVEGGKGDVS